MGIIEHLARKAGELSVQARHPVRTLKAEYNEGYQSRIRNTKTEHVDDGYEHVKTEKMDAYSQFEKATGEKKSPPKKFSDSPGEKPVKAPAPKTTIIQKHYHYGSGSKGGKGGRQSQPKTSKVVNQGKFADVDSRLVNASNAQTNRLSNYDKRMRDMFG